MRTRVNAWARAAASSRPGSWARRSTSPSANSRATVPASTAWPVATSGGRRSAAHTVVSTMANGRGTQTAAAYSAAVTATMASASPGRTSTSATTPHDVRRSAPRAPSERQGGGRSSTTTPTAAPQQKLRAKVIASPTGPRAGSSPSPLARSAAAAAAPTAHAARKRSRSGGPDSDHEPPPPHRRGAHRRSSTTRTIGCTGATRSPTRACSVVPPVTSTLSPDAAARAGTSHHHARRGPLASHRNETPASGAISTTSAAGTNVSRPTTPVSRASAENIAVRPACRAVPGGGAGPGLSMALSIGGCRRGTPVRRRRRVSRPEKHEDRVRCGPGPTGGAEGIRTPDPLHAMEVRYQLRYSPFTPVGATRES